MPLVDTTNWNRWDYIKFYTEQWGCPVVPVAKTKKPMVQWSRYVEAMPTEEELKAWFGNPCKAFKEPPWGLAIVLQHDIFSLDIDTNQLYKELKARGAFPQGTCLYKSAKGYHAIMRSSSGTPYTVREHNEVLAAINPLFDELGIGADNNHLSIMPDTPQRYWMGLYQQPAEVNYDHWLSKYIGWTRTEPYAQHSGWQPETLCPYHELDEPGHEPSLRCNVDTGAFFCHGCGKRGTFSELVKEAERHSYTLPDYVYQWVDDFNRRNKPPITPDKKAKTLFSVGEARSFEDMPPALVDGVMWRGDVVMLYASPGVGKSSLLTSATSDLISGRDFWGIEGWKCNEGLKVLYLDCENPVGESYMAIKTACGDDVDPEAMRRAYVWELIGQGFNISDPEWAEAVETNITEYGIDVVIADNLGKLTGRNTVDDFEMRKLTALFRILVRKHNILLFVIHHTGHTRYNSAGEAMPSHAKGGSSLTEDVNASFYVIRLADKENQVRVTCEKIRSRKAHIRMGDKWVLLYNPATMYVSPAAVRLTMTMARWLVDKEGLDGAAALLGVTKPAMSNYANGQREPQKPIRVKLEELCRKGGYVPRLADASV